MLLSYTPQDCEKAKQLLSDNEVKGTDRCTGYELVWLANQLLKEEKKKEN